MRELHFFGLILGAIGLVACSSQPPAPLESRGSGTKIAKVSTAQTAVATVGATTSAVAMPAPVEMRSDNLQMTTISAPKTSTTAITTTTATTITSTSAAPGAGYYRVKAKENLYRIALEHGQDYREVAKWNNIANPAEISEGMLIRITPPDGSPAPVIAKTTGKAAAGSSRKITPNVSKVAYGDSKKTTAAAKTPSKPAAPKVEPAKTTSAAAATKTSDQVVWAWPTPNPLRTGYSAATKGLEFSGKLGDPILAAADGKVVYAGSGLRGYGELVIIKHSATFLSAYGHNRAILVKEGDSVQRGQKIAEMGNSDSSTIQLHFEVRRQGKPVDPTQYLPARQ